MLISSREKLQPYLRQKTKNYKHNKLSLIGQEASKKVRQELINRIKAQLQTKGSRPNHQGCLLRSHNLWVNTNYKISLEEELSEGYIGLLIHRLDNLLRLKW